jgi:hypothetical protein
MPMKRALLADFCDGPAGMCDAVELDCGKCVSVNKKIAEERSQKGEKKESLQKSES